MESDTCTVGASHGTGCDVSLTAVPTELFSLEIQTCVVTGNGLGIRVSKVTNVLSFSCLCPRCDERFTDEVSLKLHCRRSHVIQTWHVDKIASGLVEPTEIKSWCDTHRDSVVGGAAIGEVSAIIPSADDGNSLGPCNRDENTRDGNIRQENIRGDNIRDDNLCNDNTRGDDKIVRHEADTCARLFKQDSAVRANKIMDPTSENDYNCLVCGQGFSSKINLYEHKQKQHGNAKCTKCDKQFSSVAGLKLHERVHKYGNKNARMAPIKISKTKSNSSLQTITIKTEPVVSHSQSIDEQSSQSHQQLSQPQSLDEQLNQSQVLNQRLIERETIAFGGKVTLECKTCGLKLVDLQQYFAHKRSHDKEKPFRCIDCGLRYTTQHNLVIHRRKHTGQNVFECLTCGKKLSSARNLKTHSRMHANVRPYQCLICSRGFLRKAALDDHNKKHKMESANSPSRNNHQQSADAQVIPVEGRPTENFQCGICGLKVHRPQRYMEHMFTHTGEKPYVCTVCGQAYRVKSLLTMHYRQHLGEVVYKCHECGKQCSSAFNLRIHNMSHTGERPFMCSVCGKGFTTADRLKSHMMSHTREYKYSCQDCGKPFPTQQRLKSHRRVHTGEKPYLCTTCGKRFSAQSRFKEHLMIHTGEKPYVCDVCGKAFNQPQTLKDHAAMHGNKPAVICPHCGKTFKYRTALYAHVKKAPGEKHVKKGN